MRPQGRTPAEVERLVRAFARKIGMGVECVEQQWQDNTIVSYAVEIGYDRGTSTLFPDSFFKDGAWENALARIILNKLATIDELEVIADLNGEQS